MENCLGAIQAMMMMLIYLKMARRDVCEAAIFIPTGIFPVKTVVCNQALSRETFKVINSDNFLTATTV